MTYEVRLTGTYKYRVRTQILWFWVVEPWKTVKIDFLRFMTANTDVSLVPLKSVPFEVSLGVRDGLIDVTIDLAGAAVWQQAVAVPIGFERGIHAEPVKGCILDVVASVKAVGS